MLLTFIAKVLYLNNGILEMEWNDVILENIDIVELARSSMTQGKMSRYFVVEATWGEK